MNLFCLGISFHTAPIALRERLALAPAARAAFLRDLVDAERGAELSAAALLTTCNRTEAYAVAADAERQEARVLERLAELAGLSPDRLAPRIYRHQGLGVARHLMGVAAGLDSMVLGESEILGQVRDAGEAARAAGTLDGVLEALFTRALRAGRRARHETTIGQGAASVPGAAVELARRLVGDLRGQAVALVGAGKMGVLTAQTLVAAGARGLVVSNRSYERAVALANAWDGCAVTFDRLQDALCEADIAICSTSAPHAVLRREDLAAVMARRAGRPLTIIDIAVPRDVEPAAADLPGLRLYDIDDLAGAIEGSLAERAAEIPAVAAIVDDELARFAQWLAARELRPTIIALRQWAEGVREQELARTLRRLEHLDPRDQALVAAMSEALVAKLLHPPIAALKREAGPPGGQPQAEWLRSLFDLDPPANGKGPGRG